MTGKRVKDILNSLSEEELQREFYVHGFGSSEWRPATMLALPANLPRIEVYAGDVIMCHGHLWVEIA